MFRERPPYSPCPSSENGEGVTEGDYLGQKRADHPEDSFAYHLQISSYFFAKLMDYE
jgi:hypothetical protein